MEEAVSAFLSLPHITYITTHYPLVTTHYHSLPLITSHYHSLPLITPTSTRYHSSRLISEWQGGIKGVWSGRGIMGGNESLSLSLSLCLSLSLSLSSHLELRNVFIKII